MAKRESLDNMSNYTLSSKMDRYITHASIRAEKASQERRCKRQASGLSNPLGYKRQRLSPIQEKDKQVTAIATVSVPENSPRTSFEWDDLINWDQEGSTDYFKAELPPTPPASSRAQSPEAESPPPSANTNQGVGFNITNIPATAFLNNRPHEITIGPTCQSDTSTAWANLGIASFDPNLEDNSFTLEDAARPWGEAYKSQFEALFGISVERCEDSMIEQTSRDLTEPKTKPILHDDTTILLDTCVEEVQSGAFARENTKSMDVYDAIDKDNEADGRKKTDTMDKLFQELFGKSPSSQQIEEIETTVEVNILLQELSGNTSMPQQSEVENIEADAYTEAAFSENNGALNEEMKVPQLLLMSPFKFKPQDQLRTLAPTPQPDHAQVYQPIIHPRLQHQTQMHSQKLQQFSPVSAQIQNVLKHDQCTLDDIMSSLWDAGDISFPSLNIIIGLVNSLPGISNCNHSQLLLHTKSTENDSESRAATIYEIWRVLFEKQINNSQLIALKHEIIQVLTREVTCPEAARDQTLPEYQLDLPASPCSHLRDQVAYLPMTEMIFLPAMRGRVLTAEIITLPLQFVSLADDKNVVSLRHPVSTSDYHVRLRCCLASYFNVNLKWLCQPPVFSDLKDTKSMFVLASLDQYDLHRHAARLAMSQIQSVRITLFLHKCRFPDGVTFNVAAHADCYDENGTLMEDEQQRYAMHSELSMSWTVLYQNISGLTCMKRWDKPKCEDLSALIRYAAKSRFNHSGELRTVEEQSILTASLERPFPLLGASEYVISGSSQSL